MTSKSTPGPWDADIEDVSETFKHRAVIGPNGELVADCDGHRMSGEETAANAHLIAAAPELLAMLKSMRRTIVSMGLDLEVTAPESINATTYMDDVRRIDALIAKAVQS